MRHSAKWLDGPVPAPEGAQINAQDQVPAEEPTFTVDGDTVGAATEPPIRVQRR